ncbi:MAG: Mur ligase domain-containing protein, partial [Candidatus Acidiferrales bacterium]
MELARLLKGVETLEPFSGDGPQIAGLAYDSRQVRPGFLFAAIKGEKLDGHKFI